MRRWPTLRCSNSTTQHQVRIGAFQQLTSGIPSNRTSLPAYNPPQHATLHDTQQVFSVTILDDILVKTRITIERDRNQVSAEKLRTAIATMSPCRDFHAALAVGDEVQLIAEVKRASPSAGLIREDFSPPDIAAAYQDGGAACISVLTDEPFFQGSLDYLRAVRQCVDLPILRKDFIIDEYQLLQARAAGADAVLLIAECLSPEEMQSLDKKASDLGLQTLIELFEPNNLDAVLATQTRLVGINNRDLRTFQTDLEHTVRLAENIPSDRLVIGESGIRTHADVLHLKAAGVKGILVGESLMRQPNITQATRTLLGKT
ncbi:indole-3-glycerol phosphate synthase [Rhodopirellula sallentina SM41]|uniref:Indole-3-glycerol phosphate synthase n=1 Tax=Rhodopirellula sallentina SM41 TaxID=1263870 RepID=M5U6R9_9BACT|nr:indole-3-glycerol phosphate synthase [Rhodopirellula sallentina SM41]